MGGLPRRATVIEQYRQKGPTFVVDGGDAYWRNRALPDNRREEQEVRATIMARGLALTGIDAMGIGEGDVALGWDQVVKMAETNELPYVASNLDCEGEPPFPSHRVVERDGITVGFVGAVPEAAEVEGCTVQDPVTATAAAVEALPETDMVLALGAWDADKATKLVKAEDAVTFVVGAGSLSISAPRALTPNAWLLGTGSRGKYLGVVEAGLVPGGEGWQMQNPGDDVQKRLERFRNRLKTSKSRLEKLDPDDPANQSVVKRTRRQIDFYEREIAKMENELAQLTAPRDVPPNTFENHREKLNSGVEENQEVAALVDEGKKDMPERKRKK